MRAASTATISFGLVAVPVKLYLAASDKSVSMNLLTKSGNHVKQKYHDAVTDEVVDYKELDRGYEFAKGQFVKFTEDELKALQLQTSQSIDIKEFVPESEIDVLRIEKTYYLGPDKGADKGYELLSSIMSLEGKVAVAQWGTKGKQHLVILRPYAHGMILQVLYYDEEVRDFSEVQVRKSLISDGEMELARKLVGHLSKDRLDMKAYRDEYAHNVATAVEIKVSGKEVTVVEVTVNPTIIDLFEALKRSLPSTAKRPKK